MNVARLCALSVIAACACSRPRASPDELAAALTGQGLHVEKKAELDPKPEWVGAELGVDLVLDYDEAYRGIRFSSIDLARGYCQEGPGGVLYRSWCVEPVATSPRHEVWSKVAQLRTR